MAAPCTCTVFQPRRADHAVPALRLQGQCPQHTPGAHVRTQAEAPDICPGLAGSAAPAHPMCPCQDPAEAPDIRPVRAAPVDTPEALAARLFRSDNRAVVPGTLHRITALRDRDCSVVGLTYRMGRAVAGAPHRLPASPPLIEPIMPSHHKVAVTCTQALNQYLIGLHTQHKAPCHDSLCRLCYLCLWLSLCLAEDDRGTASVRHRGGRAAAGRVGCVVGRRGPRQLIRRVCQLISAAAGPAWRRCAPRVKTCRLCLGWIQKMLGQPVVALCCACHAAQ